jgi:hypothetical protein
LSGDPQNPTTNSSQPGADNACCPHCGEVLSPWQQVLLAVDRALVCKSCWYRIILEGPEELDRRTPAADSPPED